MRQSLPVWAIAYRNGADLAVCWWHGHPQIYWTEAEARDFAADFPCCEVVRCVLKLTGATLARPDEPGGVALARYETESGVG